MRTELKKKDDEIEKLRKEIEIFSQKQDYSGVSKKVDTNIEEARRLKELSDKRKKEKALEEAKKKEERDKKAAARAESASPDKLAAKAGSASPEKKKPGVEESKAGGVRKSQELNQKGRATPEMKDKPDQKQQPVKSSSKE